MSAPPTQPNSSARLHFVDLLRGWAVLVMIETHVVNAVILPSIKLETPFKILTFINGLVAPSFLFCAGFAFAISFHRKWNEYVSLQYNFWRYLFRMLFILIVAYSLHLPFFSLSKMQALSGESAWIPFFQVDILQIIAVVLSFLAMFAVITRKVKIFLPTASLVFLAVVFASPILRQADFISWPIWFRPYVSAQFRSQFPLFPWSAFLIGGTLVGFYFLRLYEAGKLSVAMKRFLLLGIGMVVVSLLVEWQPLTVYPHHDFWNVSPEFFFVRFGIIVLALVLLWWKTQGGASGGSFLMMFGQESLLVYTIHLLIVYGYTYDFSFVRLFGSTLTYPQCFGLFAGLTLLMFGMAYVWHWTKNWNGKFAKVVQAVVLTAIVAAFLLK